MPPVIAAAITAALPAAGATAVTVGATAISYAAIAAQVLFAAANIGAQYLLAMGNKPRASATGITNRQTDGPRFFVTGRGRIGGTYLFEESYVGGWYGMGVIFNCGPTSAVEKIEIDDRNMAFDAFSGDYVHYADALFIPDRFFMNVDIAMGRPAGYASQWLIDKFGSIWTTQHKAQGLSVFYGVMAKPKGEILNLALPNGKPLLKITIRGAPVHDPRDPNSDPYDDPYDPQTWNWSDNPVLQAASYAIHPEGGLRYLPDEIDWESVAVAANRCDVAEDVYGGASEAFARAGTTWTTAEPARDVMARYMASCDGFYEEDETGKLRFGVAGWEEPSLTLTDADLGAITVDYDSGRLAAANRYEITFVDPSRGYEPNATLLVEDEDHQRQTGQILSQQLFFEAVQSPSQAYRMGVRLMRRELGKRRVSGVGGPVALALVGRRFVNVDAPARGVVGTFRVQPVETDGTFAEVSITLVEASEADYGPVPIPQDTEETVTALTQATVEVPVNLALTDRPGTGGDHIQAEVDPPSGSDAGTVDGVEFEWREDLGGGSFGAWTPFVASIGLWAGESQVLGSGDYQVRARFVNVSGLPGAWGASGTITI